MQRLLLKYLIAQDQMVSSKMCYLSSKKMERNLNRQKTTGEKFLKNTHFLDIMLRAVKPSPIYPREEPFMN